MKLLKQDNVSLSWRSKTECFVNTAPAKIEYKYKGIVFEVKVPKGFMHDGASIPRVLWSLLGIYPAGPMSDASFFHDFFYVVKGKYHGLSLTRGQVDKLFVQGLKISGLSWHKRNIAYLGVRLGGGFLWAKDKKPLKSYFEK